MKRTAQNWIDLLQEKTDYLQRMWTLEINEDVIWTHNELLNFMFYMSTVERIRGNERREWNGGDMRGIGKMRTGRW